MKLNIVSSLFIAICFSLNIASTLAQTLDGGCRPAKIVNQKDDNYQGDDEGIIGGASNAVQITSIEVFEEDDRIVQTKIKFLSALDGQVQTYTSGSGGKTINGAIQIPNGVHIKRFAIGVTRRGLGSGNLGVDFIFTGIEIELTSGNTFTRIADPNQQFLSLSRENSIVKFPVRDNLKQYV